jgi:hypothetical protein
MPTKQPIIQTVVDERTKLLVNVLAALNGQTPSAFVFAVLQEYVDKNLTPEEQETYLKKSQVGHKAVKETPRRFTASKR